MNHPSSNPGYRPVESLPLACTQRWLCIMYLCLTIQNNVNESILLSVENLHQGLGTWP